MAASHSLPTEFTTAENNKASRGTATTAPSFLVMEYSSFPFTQVSLVDNSGNEMSIFCQVFCSFHNKGLKAFSYFIPFFDLSALIHYLPVSTFMFWLSPNLITCSPCFLLLYLPEVCQSCKHVVMMRPDLLVLSLLATHQPVSLLQPATNLSDYISPSL